MGQFLAKYSNFAIFRGLLRNLRNIFTHIHSRNQNISNAKKVTVSMVTKLPSCTIHKFFFLKLFQLSKLMVFQVNIAEDFEFKFSSVPGHF